MVAVLVRLKLTLLRNGLRRSTWRTVGLVIGAVYALGVVVLAWLGMIALRSVDDATTGEVTVIAFALLTVAWLFLSLLVFGIDETVDPRRFALLPVPARRLVPGLFVSGLISVPGVATSLGALGLVVTWARYPITVLASLVGAVLGVATCFLLSRAATSAFTRALGSRRFRDFAAVALALVGASVGIISNLAGRASATNVAELRALLTRTAEVVGWSPFGWAWSVPADVARGAWPTAGVRLVLAAGLVAGLWYAWRHFLALGLCSPMEGSGGSKPVSRHGFAERLYPATPTGAVASRSLRYWRRDPRYLSSLASLCIAPIVVVVATSTRSSSQQTPVAAFVPVFLALLLGAVVSQDLSYDGTSLWTHITSGIPGSVDRAGRVLSTLTVVGPLLVVVTLGVALISRQWDLLPRIGAATIACALISLGVGSWTGAIWQIPAPPPGANPFAKNAGGGGLKGLVSFLVTGGITLAASLPTLGLVIASVWVPWLEWPALVVALASGLLAIRIGIRGGGRRLDAHWPEVLEAVSARS